jgi:hypothetical protein
MYKFKVHEVLGLLQLCVYYEIYVICKPFRGFNHWLSDDDCLIAIKIWTAHTASLHPYCRGKSMAKAHSQLLVRQTATS